MTVVHLVRHGQSGWNLTGRLQGQTAHVQLTAAGRAQALAAADLLQGKDVDVVYSSDLLRARQTADLIATRLGLDVRPTAGLRERGYGSFEGQLSTRVLGATTDIDWTDPDARIGGGESLRDVFTRVGRTLATISNHHPDGHVVAVSHGDTIRVALAWLNGGSADHLPWRDVPNGSITTVSPFHRAP